MKSLTFHRSFRSMASVLLTLVALGSLSWKLTGNSEPKPSTNFVDATDDPLVVAYPGGNSSYVIFTDGTTVYALNNTTGNIDYQREQAYAADVIRSTIARWRTVFIKSGVYSLTSPLDLVRDFTFELESGAILEVPNGYSSYVFGLGDAVNNVHIIGGYVRENMPQFDIDEDASRRAEFSRDLTRGVLSDDFRGQFSTLDFPLSDDVTIRTIKDDFRWEITDNTYHLVYNVYNLPRVLRIIKDPQRKWQAILLNPSRNGVYFNSFRDTWIQNAGVAIKLLLNFPNGWINGNEFQSLRIWHPNIFIDFDDSGPVVDCDGSLTPGVGSCTSSYDDAEATVFQNNLDFDNNGVRDGQCLCADDLFNPTTVAEDNNNNCSDGAGGTIILGTDGSLATKEVRPRTPGEDASERPIWAFKDEDGDGLLDDGEALYIKTRRINRNYFEDIMGQAGRDTEYGAKNIRGYANMFVDVKFFDLNNITSPGVVSSASINKNADSTIILGGFMTHYNFTDNGKGTRVIDQDRTWLPVVSAVIRRGQIADVVNDNRVTPNSHIMVTLNGDPGVSNGVRFVKNRYADSPPGFTVVLNRTAPADIPFTYFIVH